MESIMVKGKMEYIMDDLDFVRVLWDAIGDDGAQWFEKRIAAEQHDAMAAFRREPEKYCTGECDRVYAMQEAHENTLHDIEDITRRLYASVQRRKISRENAEVLQALAAIIKLCK